MAAKAWSVQVRDVKARDANGAHGVQVQIQETTQLPTTKSFLLSQPSGGVYTCARATRSRGLATTKHELVLWDFHLERLATGIRSVATDISNAAGFATEAQWITEMQRVTTALCEDVLRYLSERERPPVDADLMVTALWWTEPSSAEKLRYNVSVHACVMPTPSNTNTTSTVLINGPPRPNPLCKHTSWIADRVPLEEHTSQISATHGPIHETILSSSTGGGGDDARLLEGLITNFFVVQDGSVMTAADGVLHGSTRELVLRACEELEIPVIFQAPRFCERERWQAAFVTSAVRLAISVTRVLWSDSVTSEIHELQLRAAGAENAAIVHRIRQRILDRHYFLGE
ncbi:Aminotransferase, class iv [Globisporangium polare]